jgi:hypothetical protein
MQPSCPGSRDLNWTGKGLIWDCCHSLVKLVDHKRIQLVWVLGHVLIDGNKIAD